MYGLVFIFGCNAWDIFFFVRKSISLKYKEPPKTKPELQNVQNS